MILFQLVFCGCNSYIQRTVWQSIASIGNPVPPPPHMITTPILQNVKLSVSWAGHATTLIQIQGKIIITDPLLRTPLGWS